MRKSEPSPTGGIEASEAALSPQKHIDGVILAVEEIAREAGAILEAAAAVHDVLNALSPARGYAQLAVADPTNIDILLASARATLAAVERCEAILDSVLGRCRPSPASCNVFHVVRACADGERARVAGETNHPALAAAISPVDLDHVISNLIQNARRASETATVDLHVLASGGWIEVHVTDDGPGVGGAGLGDSCRSSRHVPPRAPGAGVGLWKSYQLIRAAGGELLALKNVPRGTRMVVRLPRAA